MKTLIATLALSVVSTLSTPAQQFGPLHLRFDGAPSLDGIWAYAEAGQAIRPRVEGLGHDARVFLIASPIRTMGEIDRESAWLLDEGRMLGADDYSAKLALPAFAADLPGLSIQAVALDAFGDLWASPVMTLIIVDEFPVADDQQGGTGTTEPVVPSKPAQIKVDPTAIPADQTGGSGTSESVVPTKPSETKVDPTAIPADQMGGSSSESFTLVKLAVTKIDPTAIPADQQGSSSADAR